MDGPFEILIRSPVDKVGDQRDDPEEGYQQEYNPQRVPGPVVLEPGHNGTQETDNRAFLLSFGHPQKGQIKDSKVIITGKGRLIFCKQTVNNQLHVLPGDLMVVGRYIKDLAVNRFCVKFNTRKMHFQQAELDPEF